MTDSIYVGQLPSDMQENDVKKLFPKATKVSVTPAEGSRPGHAFLTFSDDSAAAAAVKQGATFKNTQLKVAFQNKRSEPQKRSAGADDRSGPQAKKLKGDTSAGKGSANGKGLKGKGKPSAGSDDDEDDEDDDDEESMDFAGEDDDEEEEDESDEEDDEVEGKNIKKTVAKMVAGGKSGKPAGKNVEEADDEEEDADDDDEDESDDDDDEDDDDEEEEEETPSKSKKTPPSSAKQSTPATVQDKNKGKASLAKPAVIDNSLQKKNKSSDQTVSNKPASAEAQKRSVDVADKSGPQTKKLKNETPTAGKNVPVGNKNGLKGKANKNDDEDEDDDDDDDDDELDFDEDDDDDDDEEETPKKPAAKSPATGKQAKPVAKPSAVEDDEDDEDDSDDDDDDEDDEDDEEEEEEQKPTKTTTKPTPPSKKTKPTGKPTATKDEEDDDDDDDDEEDDDDEDDEESAAPPAAPLKSALKQKPSSTPTPTKQKPSSTPTKTETKPTENTKQETSNANKTLNKTQLFINSIKESVSVSDVKTLYPKAKSVKMQKRKVGPNHKVVQFAFVTFENESDCAEAFTAHTQLGGEKVNVSYAFAQTGKKQEQKKPNTDNDSNNKNKTKPTTPNENAKKTENTKKKEKTIPEKQLSTNAIYVGQLPEHVAEDDIKKLFPKANKVELIAAKATNKGVRPGFAFVTFPDDNSAAAAIKLGPSLTLKNTQLKVAYQAKRATPTTATE
jgi:nucleolin